MSAARRLLLFALLALPLAFAGCAPLSPEAQCFAKATIAYRGAWRGAEKVRADLARGYALHVVDYRGLRAGGCGVPGTHGICLDTVQARVTVPVSVERAVLEERLAALEAKMDALRPAAMAAAAPCGYGPWSQRYLATQAPAAP